MTSVKRKLTQPGNLPTCTAHARSGEQCKRKAMVGTTVCNMHGGKSPGAQRKHQQAIVRKGLARLVEPVDEDDVEADPIEGFSFEYRRTVAAIRYCGEQVSMLANEGALVWGMTKEVQVESSEFPGVDITYEAKINAWEAKRFQERQHLLDLQKLFINAGIAERRIALDAGLLDSLNGILNSVVIGLDANPQDPAIRAVIRAAIEGVSVTPSTTPAKGPAKTARIIDA